MFGMFGGGWNCWGNPPCCGVVGDWFGPAPGAPIPGGGPETVSTSVPYKPYWTMSASHLCLAEVPIADDHESPVGALGLAHSWLGELSSRVLKELHHTLKALDLDHYYLDSWASSIGLQRHFKQSASPRRV